MWKAYSFNWRPLGGKVATRQIFIGIQLSKQADAEVRPELLGLPAWEIEERFLLQATGEADGILHHQVSVLIFQPAANREVVGDGGATLNGVVNMEADGVVPGRLSLDAPVPRGHEVDESRGAEFLGDAGTRADDAPRAEVFSEGPDVQTIGEAAFKADVGRRV